MKELDALVRNIGVEDWYLNPYGELNYDTGKWFERDMWISQISKNAGVKL